MATINDGILGAFIGKSGPVTGYIRNGKNVLRTSTRRKDSVRSEARLAQQQKIKVCEAFTRPFTGTGFFAKTFPAIGTGGTGHNRATCALMNLAITGTYPNTTLSYPDVLISKGLLPGASQATASKNSDGNIVFSWADNSGNGTAKEHDKVILVAYFPALQQAIFSIDAGVRSDGQAVLATDPITGATAETWIGFLSDDEKEAANSVYTGSVAL